MQGDLAVGSANSSPIRASKPMSDMVPDKHSIARLRLLGFLEGCSLLVVLVIAVPLKHLAGWPLAVEIMGPTHGIALALYIAAAVQTLAAGGFNAIEVIRLFCGRLDTCRAFLQRRAAATEAAIGRMMYLAAKSLHLIAMVIWMTWLVSMPIILSFVHTKDGVSAVKLNALRDAERFLYGPAMLATWAIGMGLALYAGSFGSGWLWAKFGIVLLLTVFHGLLVGRLVCASRGERRHGAKTAIWILPGAVASLTAIVFLVIVKPF